MTSIILRLLSLTVCVTLSYASISSMIIDSQTKAGACQVAACPPGWTGRFCDVALCDSRGTVNIPTPSQGYAIDIIPLTTTCAGSFGVPVDSHAQVLLLFVDGTDYTAMPTIQLYDRMGTNISPSSTLSNNNKTMILAYNGITSGEYVAKISAQTPCVYQAHAQTDFSISLGFTSGRRMLHDDNPSETLMENTISTMVLHLNNVPFPGRADAIEIYGGSTLAAGYPLSTRYGCGYELYAGPGICTRDQYWYFKVRGVDENGFRFMRSDAFRCTPSGVTTTGPVVTTAAPNPCMHNGFMDPNTNNCICEPFWTGNRCQTPRCFNGGSVNGDNCTCATGYGGFHCDVAMCSSKNPIGPFNTEQRTLALVIQATASMVTDITALQDLAQELLETFQAQHSQFIQNYIVVTYDDTSANLAAYGSDPLLILEHIYHMSINNATQKCQKQLNAGLLLAMQKVNPYSYIYVLTDSGIDLSNSTSNLNVFSQLEATKNRVTFFITAPLCQNISDAEFRRMYDLSEFSGGQALYASRKYSALSLIRTIPTAYRTARVYDRRGRDCTREQYAYVPIDSHTSAFTVTVHGYHSSLVIYQPDGTLYTQNTLVDDEYVQVRQVISPCPPNWQQRDNVCFSPEYRSRSWTDAALHCHERGAVLVSIMNRERQFLLDLETEGTSYWTGLNDIKSEGAFTWDALTPNQLPLGHWYTNWAPGHPLNDPTHTNNCVASVYANNTSKWTDMPCSTELPYVCQKHAADKETNRLPAGYWKVEYRTLNDSGFGGACHVQINAQSDMQVFFGFTTDQFSDMPAAEPQARVTTNRFVANMTNLDYRAYVDQIEYFDSNYTLIASSRIFFRENCAYNLYSNAFACPKSAFGMLLTGHDEYGYLFNRLNFGICLGSGEDLPHLDF